MERTYILKFFLSSVLKMFFEDRHRCDGGLEIEKKCFEKIKTRDLKFKRFQVLIVPLVVKLLVYFFFVQLDPVNLVDFLRSLSLSSVPRRFLLVFDVRDF